MNATNILTPASGLKVGDMNGFMEVVKVECDDFGGKAVVHWAFPDDSLFIEAVGSSDSYMVQRALPTHVVYGRKYVIAAEFKESEDGIKAANDFMMANPGHGLLDIADGRVIVAALADNGAKL